MYKYAGMHLYYLASDSNLVRQCQLSCTRGACALGDTTHVQLGFNMLKERGYPASNIEGGNTDHPTESEIRKLVKLCYEDVVV